MNKNEAVFEWLKQYEGFQYLMFNFATAQTNYQAMLPYPTDYLVYEDVTGAKIREYTFAVSHFKHFTNLPNTTENIDNMEEVQKFLNWIDKQDEESNYPDFPSNCKIEYVKNLNNIPTVTKSSNNLAQFYSQIKIRYIEK